MDRIFSLLTVKGSLGRTAKRRAQWINVALPAAAICFVLGVTLPIVRVENLFIFTEKVSIVGAVYQLASENEFLLAAIIALFSIGLPAAKILIADIVWRFCPAHTARNSRAFHILAKISHWSMLDVVVIAGVIVVYKASGLAEASSQPGLYFFFASIILSGLSMLAIRRSAEATTNAQTIKGA
jgi:paraquat-inducible protein A